MLLGRGRLVHQQIVLKRGAPEEQPLGLVGNVVVLTQPKSSKIIQTLPPPREHFSDGIVVLFTTGRQDAKKAKMLQVPRAEYLRCARLRAQVCDAFADITVSEEAVLENLPDQGVPDAFVEAALEMQEAEHLIPNFSGPASMRNPDAADQREVQAQAEVGEACAHDDDALEEHDDTCDQVMAESLIGLGEAHVDDPGARFAVLQHKFEIHREETEKLYKKEKQASMT